MSRLLIICQKVDENDDLLGFFVSWIAGFAAHFTEVDVITLGVGSYALPVNVRVHSLGKERGVPKWRQALYLVHLLWRYTPGHGAVFCHMSPIFAIVAWPLAAIRCSRLVLWYLHRSRTLKLRLALMFSNRLVTADAESLTVRSQKIIAVGHGIDVERFTVSGRTPPVGRPLRILSVGRLSPIKGLETLIRAAALLGEHEIPVDVRIVGKAVMSGDHEYARLLQELVSRLGLTGSVHFWGFVPYRDIAPLYAWADIVVGCTPTGGIDKAILEGMAAACTVVTSNIVMRKYFVPVHADEYMFRHGDPADLADTLERLLSADLSSIGNDMQQVVTRNHNLPVTIGKIVTFL